MSILLTCAVAGLAWWLGWQSAKVRIIDTLKERLKIARQQCNDIKTRLSDLKSQVEMQEKLISELLNKSDPTNKRVGESARGNTKIQNTLTDLTTSTPFVHRCILKAAKRRLCFRAVGKSIDRRGASLSENSVSRTDWP
jgi:hypothetical protein